MLANILILTVLNVVSSRNVPYKENSDIVAIIDNIFGPRSNSGGQHAHDVKNYDTYATSPGKTVDTSCHVLATTEPIDQFMNQYFHHQHRSSNGHVNCDSYVKNTTNKKTDGTSGISSMVNTQSSFNISNSNLNPRSKTNRNSTKTNPVTRNFTQNNSTFQRTNGRTNASVENATLKNVDKTIKEIFKDRNEGKTIIVDDGAAKTDTTNNVDEDRWIWDTSTTEKPSTEGLADRAAFSGDECPSGQVKLGTICVDEDKDSMVLPEVLTKKRI